MFVAMAAQPELARSLWGWSALSESSPEGISSSGFTRCFTTGDFVYYTLHSAGLGSVFIKPFIIGFFIWVWNCSYTKQKCVLPPQQRFEGKQDNACETCSTPTVFALGKVISSLHVSALFRFKSTKRTFFFSYLNLHHFFWTAAHCWPSSMGPYSVFDLWPQDEGRWSKKLLHHLCHQQSHSGP